MTLKLNIQKSDLLTALGSLQNITGKKGTMAVLANILLKTKEDSLELIATDLEVGIRKNIPAEIVAPGTITLPSKKLFEIVRESGSDLISLEELENNWVKIHVGTSVYNLAGISSEEYPEFPDYNTEQLTAVPAELISELIDKTIYSVAQERESNFTLTGVLFEKEEEGNKNYLKMVSSDGHRLSIMRKEAPLDLTELKVEKNIVIPRKGIIEIKKLCEGEENISIGLEKKQIVLKNEKSLLIIRLLTGEFPEYNNIISLINRDNYLEIERISFLESLKRTSIFTDDTFNSIQLEIKNSRMILSSQNIDLGNATDELKINYKGDNITLGFNCKYLIDTLNIINGDTIKTYISSDQSPCLIESDDDIGFLSIIMPMKL